jgi:predicted nucleotide-binding protein
VPELYADFPIRGLPDASGTSDYEGRGYIERTALEDFIRDLNYVFEVRSGSQTAMRNSALPPRRVFISHGLAADWQEVQPFIERDLGISTLELAQEPNRGRTVLQKLTEEGDRCSYAVIVMTGDDVVGADAPRARENVMHEIGFFQGKYGLHRVSLLHEEGTSIPSNIHGLVYIPFPKALVSASFGTLQRELKDAFNL